MIRSSKNVNYLPEGRMPNILIFLLCCLSILHSQEYNQPESAVYDPAGKRYFISNFGDGNIIELDSSGEKNYFKTGLSNSLGMIISNDILYVVSERKNVYGFSLINGDEVFRITIAEAAFLNDITCDNRNNLYVSGSNTGAIYKITPADSSYSVYWNKDLDGPNGILFNEHTNSIVVCNFVENALIQSISLDDSVIVTLDSTGIDNLDGLAMDETGNIYVSCWRAGSFQTGFPREGAVYKYDNSLNIGPELIINNLYGPADIFYNPYKRELAIPLLLDNQLKFIPVSSNTNTN